MHRPATASCGTALTNTQVRTLKRHSGRIVVNFDPDAAGANAAERSIQMLLDESMRVRVLELENRALREELAALRDELEWFESAVERVVETIEKASP